MEYTAQIPADLALELQTDGLARPIPQVRSSGAFLADLMIVVDGAAAIVTLLGTPIGTNSISERIVHWLRRPQSESGVKILMRARGRHGRVEMEIDNSTDISDIAATISDLVKSLDAE
jgi:hypothetical protein